MVRSDPLPSELAAALASAEPRLGLFARRAAWFAEVASTNDLAAVAADSGVAEGYVVVADSQTTGRGRHGRVWCSPAGAGLYTSVVLRPDEVITPLLTIAAGVALAEGITAATGLAPDLKWPNDLYVSERKVGGILAEAGGEPARASGYVVLGFGINVRPGAYPPEVSARATSLEGELGRAVDRGAVLAESLAALARRYDDLRRGRRDAVVDAWRALAAPLLRRAVEWDGPAGALRGVAEDIDEAGALIVQTPTGRERIISGEVRWM